MRNLLLALFLGLPGILNCQTIDEVEVSLDSVLKAYNSTTIFITGNYGYIKDDKRFFTGLFNENLARELKTSPQAHAIYRSYLRKTWTGIGLTLGSMATAYGVSAVSPDPAVAVLLIPYIGGCVIAISATSLFHRSIWTYNREVLMAKLARASVQ